MNNDKKLGDTNLTPNDQKRREPPIIDAKAVNPKVHGTAAPQAGISVAPETNAATAKVGDDTSSTKPTPIQPKDAAPAQKMTTSVAVKRPRSSVAFAVLAGAGIALLGSIALHMSDDSKDAITELRSQVSKQNQQITDLQNGSRLAIDKLQSRIASLSINSAAHSKDADAGETQAALTAMQSRIDALNSALPVLTSDLAVQKAQIGKISSTPNAAAIAVVAQSVMRAVEQSQPFPNELKALQNMQVSADRLAPLAAIAQTGAASPNQLAESFIPILQKMSPSDAPQTSTDMVGWLVSKASSLVKVHQVGAQEGSTPTAIGSRIEADLKAGKTKDALELWNSLPASEKALGVDWVAKLQARQNAQDAAQSILSSTLMGLASPTANDVKQ